MFNKIKEHAKVCFLLKLLILFAIGGFIYICLELVYRGYSHWTMFILGGLCFLFIGFINEYIDENMHILLQACIGSIIITTLEYVCGCIVNIKLGWDVWDYSQLPLNVNGQICLLFSFLWLFVGMFAIYLDDFMRNKLFDEPMPKYRWK